MKLRIISDIHNEFTRHKTGEDWVVPETEFDKEVTLILAGDIDTQFRAPKFITKFADRFKHVVFVLGNHDYYGARLEAGERKIRAKLENLQDNIHFLHNSTVILDGVRFVGGPLWTHFNDMDYFVVDRARRSMADYNAITINDYENHYRKIRPHDIIKEYERTASYIERVLELQHSGPTVVVTHHAPSQKSVHEVYRMATDINHLYFTDQSEVMRQHKPELWFHGHMHHAFDYKVYDTRVVCNPVGYMGEEQINLDDDVLFDPCKIIEI